MKMNVWVSILFLIVMSSPLIADNPESNHLASALCHGTCLASQNQGLLQSQVINYVEGQQSEGEKYYPKYKSEATATILAALPGFFIHGLGHFYAEDYITASILFTVEIISLPMLRDLVIFPAIGEESESKFNIKHGLILVGALAFLASWIYDFAHADTAVRKYNDKVRAQIYYSSDRGDDIKVGLSVSF